MSVALSTMWIRLSLTRRRMESLSELSTAIRPSSCAAAAAGAYTATASATTQAMLSGAPCAWVEWFNHRRLYERCGDVPSAQLEAAYYAQQPAQPIAELPHR